MGPKFLPSLPACVRMAFPSKDIEVILSFICTTERSFLHFCSFLHGQVALADLPHFFRLSLEEEQRLQEYFLRKLQPAEATEHILHYVESPLRFNEKRVRRITNMFSHVSYYERAGLFREMCRILLKVNGYPGKVNHTILMILSLTEPPRRSLTKLLNHAQLTKLLLKTVDRGIMEIFLWELKVLETNVHHEMTDLQRLISMEEELTHVHRKGTGRMRTLFALGTITEQEYISDVTKTLQRCRQEYCKWTRCDEAVKVRYISMNISHTSFLLITEEPKIRKTVE